MVQLNFKDGMLVKSKTDSEMKNLWTENYLAHILRKLEVTCRRCFFT